MDDRPANANDMSVNPPERSSAVAAHLTQEIVIITSFEGRDPKAMKRNILDCMRLKYIIEERIEIPSLLLRCPIDFSVSVAYTEQGDVNEKAFNKIVNADVLIAVVSDANANVIYELATRSLIKPELLILIKNAGREILPMYLQSMGHMDFDENIDPSIQHEIDKIARNEDVNLSWSALDGAGLPELFNELKEEIDRGKDDTLARDLENNLKKMYEAPSTWPSFMHELVLQIDPAGLLHAWTTYYPTSLVRVQWSRRSENSYAPSDLASEPVVIAGNPAFCQLYGITVIGDPNNPIEALTMKVSLSKLESLMTEEDFTAFCRDQQDVSQKILFDNDFSQTKVPIKFKEHPVRQYIDGVFMPMLVGKKVVGNQRSFHTTYLLVTYIDLSGLPSLGKN